MLQNIERKLKAIFANEQLRRKLVFSALIILLYRFLAHIPVPAVNIGMLQSLFAGNQFLSLLNVFSGGTLSQFSLVAVGINPYITASIVLQLAGMVFPTIKEMQKDGESGRAKLNQYTRLLSVPLAIAQSVSIIALLRSQSLVTTFEPLHLMAMVAALVAGALILMWLGELVTEYGIGNGISMILFAGIVSQIPVAFAQTFSVIDSAQWVTILSFAVVVLGIIAVSVFMNEAVRKINIQHAKRMRGSKLYGGQTTHLPIKVNVAGVMPIIFAVTIMMVPPFLSRFLVTTSNPQLVTIGQQLGMAFSETSWIYMLVYFLIVFGFTYFSALIFFNAGDISEELKKSGAFVPGIRPGSPTKKFLEFVVTRITFAGAIFLGLLAIVPSMAQSLTGVQSLAIGGTSVLIVVSVVLETAKQVDSMLISQNYDKYKL